ncbi:MAG: hypothetical protein N4J56_007158 [Chroococcidiopsis sp. SAG 2025]|uniref:two-partner secretion domain-containing protein n=1 Tax=Chroococcidiopsis sp. SAG 2025 TaxID=171389 RepID=UPI0029371E67|nr:filamentous hemagglutinin N-terminal domain-containing protein [Chroococcidiopsis sp. SAG 2025]MDV2997453.1 hypothetical protein [Chroococcidiopsis sp. SAG 2025]
MWKTKTNLYVIGLLSIYGLFFDSCIVVAQVKPDTTLPSNSTVNQSGTTEIITGGTQAGTNLFHSFEQFSIPVGDTAYFNNALDIQNIFSRVTGSSISNIDGLIRANGIANLFLLNPNGIIFGPNARLDIGGSFLGSTASSINFADGVRFSATSPEAPPLLTVEVPVGLGFGSNPGEIRLEGVGHALQFVSPERFAGSPIAEPAGAISGLRVAPNQTLALIGGNITFDGGIVKAPAGHIEVGSVFNGTVGISSGSNSFSFDYRNISRFGDVKLFDESLLEVSGSPSGSISISANNFSLRNRSTIFASNFGSSSGRQIQIDATNSVEMIGLENSSNFQYGIEAPGGIFSQNLAEGNGSSIAIVSPNIIIKDFSNISSNNYGTGRGGDVAVNTQNINISGLPPIPNFFLPSSITSTTNSLGQAGNVTVVGSNLLLEKGGLILSQSNSLGKSGDVKVDFLESVKIDGYSNATLVFNTSNSYVPSTIGTTTSSFGDASIVSVTAPNLTISNGGRINSTTAASGNAGEINVVAKLIKLEGRIEEAQDFSSFFSSQITSSAERTNSFLNSFFDILPALTGRAGEINIVSQNILVQDSAFISAINQGSGDGGKIQIDADSIRISEQGNIATIANSGEGGDISLNSQNLQLRNGSSISATAGLAGGGGNGGNIIIDTDTLAAVNRSSITANAFTGRGGNIQITTQGIFQSPDSIFDASSQFGVDGTVEVRSLGLEPDEALVPYNRVFIPMDEVMKNSCFAPRRKKQVRLVITGNGGLPAAPGDSVMPMPLFSAEGLDEELETQSPPPSSPAPDDSGWQEGDPVVEATGIIKTKDGRTLLGMVGSNLPDAEEAICRQD